MEINEILETAIEKGASDVHLTAHQPPVMRLLGELTAVTSAILKPEDTKNLIYSILTEEQKKQFERDWELDLSYALKDTCRFRVNVYLQKGAIASALRIIPSKIPLMDDINMPKIASDLTMLNRGMVLVTGPTGSGKSTTLAAMINLINETRACHVVTVEDPIEFVHNSKKAMINQRELGADTKSFANSLKHVLRQDPDVILVGEMRDLETIAAAITLAETGHLVFSTLHTPDAPQTIDRIIDVFPAYQQQQIRMQLSAGLQGVISQQLLPKKDRSGRIAAREIMIVTPGIANLIREGKTHQIYSAIQTGLKFGMKTMDQCLNELVQAGLVDYQESLMRASNPGFIQNPAG